MHTLVSKTIAFFSFFDFECKVKIESQTEAFDLGLVLKYQHIIRS